MICELLEWFDIQQLILHLIFTRITMNPIIYDDSQLLLSFPSLREVFLIFNAILTFVSILIYVNLFPFWSI